MGRPAAAPVVAVRPSVYRFPLPEPESDGTVHWDSTTAVVVHVEAGGQTGLGWTYSTAGAAAVITDELAPRLTGLDPMDIPTSHERALHAIRNIGSGGLAMQAVSAVDIALWDLKARLLGVGLADLFGRARQTVPVYGSGGFTSMTDNALEAQVEGWLAAGCGAVKIKVAEDRGTRPERDIQRTALVRSTVGDDVAVMVDANGGYSSAQARRLGAVFTSESGVSWFEEPRSSDDPAGLARLRGYLSCDIAAGEYVSSPWEAAALCPAVDCLQLDVTRCGGYTGWLAAASVARAAHLDVSGHCAPSLHAPVAVAVPRLRHLEWFADHARLEPLLVDRVPEVADGELHLLPGPGHGLALRGDAERYRTG